MDKLIDTEIWVISALLVLFLQRTLANAVEITPCLTEGHDAF